ncbi:MAG: BirA family transcriptional regulator biotin operon repressor / biotin-acetyl-CoA-carboxylase ligase [Elusimicrobia bacterium]|nr:MAG: BirA family transcriptional regulator biotin operon repressor / biotin-acetyl-CoA-carboxylase ligase [Elusimicrobiota bacterium]KAF0153673.1 MAG: BirA family transcriptional regulator biotin operon repressor / biotin-acetyl-CoA-carboxylase ligase [Elusimicrobiota bacterium]
MKTFEHVTCGNVPGATKVLCLDEAVSTQEVARELALEGNNERTVVIAASQTGGKGRLGRKWDSGLGGLYLTVILRPRISVRFLGNLSLMAGAVISETLREDYGVTTRVKAPNDVYALQPRKKKFFKISGVLTESASVNQNPDWVLLGMGINLNNPIPKELAEAVSLSAILGRPVDRDEFLEKLFARFWKAYSAWQYSSEANS